ncbi:MAG TPA: ketoacyl-ACP synthase III [Bryobacteraceae bacterium]|nr:ketoacyl-ACP synthase III [Bryobacteraceae bacterium]
MAYLRAFGRYLPARVVDNAEIASLVGADPAWIQQVSGIVERRFAAPEESVAALGLRAGKDCLEAAGVSGSEVGLILVSSGSGERRFPGPATEIAAMLASAGIPAGVPAIDLPIASAGSLFGLSLAANLCQTYRNILVIGTEVMSRVIRLEPAGRDTAILFGDGAGACLVSAETGFARIVDSVIRSDGEFADSLRLHWDGTIYMEGRTIILHASRKLPRAILEVLNRNQTKAGEIGAFVMHQANLNLITRVAQAVGVPESRFFSNVQRYGNTSSASLLIAAAEWWSEVGQTMEGPFVMAAFGAGLNWGALLAAPYTG